MNNYIKRIVVLLMCVALVIGAPISAMAAPVAMPEPSVGQGEESEINSEEKAEASTSVDILITGTLEILARTEDCLIEEGDNLELAVQVSGVGPFKYKWEVSLDDGDTWTTPDGATNSDRYQIIDAVADKEDAIIQDYIYRVTVTDKFGNKVSEEINIGVRDAIAYRRILDKGDKVAVSAWMLKSTRLSSKGIDEGNPAYDEMYRHLTPGCLPINAVDLKLYNRTVAEKFYIGEPVVEFIVGEEYEGQTLKVFQLLDGKVVEYTGVVEDGILSITVPKLSQFMVEAPSEDAMIVEVTAGEGGSASPEGMFSVRKGRDQKIVFLPDAGYAIDKVYVDGEEVEVATNYIVLENVKADHKVEVKFKKVVTSGERHAVKIEAKKHGSADPSGYFWVDDGETIVINITPDKGYKVDRIRVNWKEEYSVVGNQFVFPAITEETYAEIFFVKDPNDPSAASRVIEASAGDNGSISPSGDVDVLYGGDMYFYIIPDEGYIIDKVYIDGAASDDIDGEYHFVNVVDDHTIHATFKKGTNPGGNFVTITAESGKNGTISPAGKLQVPKGGTQTFHFTPASGYVVKAIYVNGKLVATRGTSYTIKDIKADTTIKVEFAPVALIPTGDITPYVNTTLWWVLIGAAGGVAILMIILIIRRKKDDDEEDGQNPNGYPMN